ncbi:RimJ/RimL family protein N-acetyltransferase [Peribacillus deserti]|uniref:RimJ/RimL family protein N-acetyltransferase n=1 Tax=Peribacillus deserti TaxID=673318 RepID=A0ABS2QJ73_9BACI|nr:GNAT family N-acetyltransferase [Peribacillus deserti]MBM7693189.1 RimJ/RimL family protein N-acetyltransferase [Peribacillus deserti]
MNAILLDFPEKIESERLYIRPCQPGDGQKVFEAIQASKKELSQWLPFAQKHMSLDEVEEGVRKSFSKFITREDIRLHIFRKEDDQFIGSTGLHRMNWDIPKFEIGYWVDSRYAKKGYITEAASALTRFSFEFYRAKRVEIRCDPDNIDSRKIPEKLGFTLEGILRNDSLSADGKHPRDTCVFSKIASQ